MKRWLTSLAFIMLLVGNCWGQLEIKGDVSVVKVDKVIVVKEDMTVVNAVPFSIKAPPGALSYVWDYPNTVVAKRKANELVITAAPKGPLVIGVEIGFVDFDKKVIELKYHEISFSVGIAPTPIPPVPDPPKPAPIQAAGFRVMVINETTDQDKLTRGQQQVVFGELAQSWLIANLAKENGNPGWRFVDKDANITNDLKHWRDAFNNAKARPDFKLPWLIISDGVKGWQGPMPATLEDNMRLLNPFAPKAGFNQLLDREPTRVAQLLRKAA